MTNTTSASASASASTPPPNGLTPSQTVGPFFLNSLLRADARRDVLATAETPGVHIRITGRVLDGDGLPVPDAMVECWQADSQGRYNHPVRSPTDVAFAGFGRCGTDEQGRFQFATVRPGAVAFDAQRTQAPHICLAVFARGLLNHLFTRLYFADEPANAHDPILLLVPAERRSTLLAQRADADAQQGAEQHIAAGAGTGNTPVYHFDIHLQGADETVFFNI